MLIVSIQSKFWFQFVCVWDIQGKLLVSKFLCSQNCLDLDRMEQLGIDRRSGGSYSSSLDSTTPVSEMSESGGKVRRHFNSLLQFLVPWCHLQKKEYSQSTVKACVRALKKNIFYVAYFMDIVCHLFICLRYAVCNSKVWKSLLVSFFVTAFLSICCIAWHWLRNFHYQKAFVYCLTHKRQQRAQNCTPQLCCVLSSC